MYLSAGAPTGSSGMRRQARPSGARRGGTRCAPRAAPPPPASRPAARTSAAAAARRSCRRSRPRAASPAHRVTRSGSCAACSPRSGTTGRRRDRRDRSGCAPAWHRVGIGVAEMEARHADGGVGLVDRAVGGDAQRVLGHALAGAERRRAGIAGARVDLVEDDHARLRPAERPGCSVAAIERSSCSVCQDDTRTQQDDDDGEKCSPTRQRISFWLVGLVPRIMFHKPGQQHHEHGDHRQRRQVIRGRFPWAFDLRSRQRLRASAATPANRIWVARQSARCNLIGATPWQRLAPIIAAIGGLW